LADLKLSYPRWKIDVESPCPEIFKNNPHITPLDKNDPDLETIKVKYDSINESGQRGHHFTDAFRDDMEKQLKVKIKKNGYKPELYISDVEKSWFNQVHCEFGWDGTYWVLNAGRKQDNELKQYHRWQEVVDLLNEFFKGKVKIVQIGHQDHLHPKLKGVYNLVGKTNLRELIRLAYWSEGTIGPLSLQFVISAAFEQPAVCVAGGKEGVKWHLYPHMRYIYTNGALDCCSWDGCWLGGEIGKCKKITEGVPKCFRMIKPYMIADGVKMYYEGGVCKMPNDKKYEELLKTQKEIKKKSN